MAAVREGRGGKRGLFTISFLESTVLPIPIEVALVPLMAMLREHMWSIATVIARGVQYWGLALLVHLFGDSAGAWLYRHQGQSLSAVAALVIAVMAIQVRSG